MSAQPNLDMLFTFLRPALNYAPDYTIEAVSNRKLATMISQTQSLGLLPIQLDVARSILRWGDAGTFS